MNQLSGDTSDLLLLNGYAKMKGFFVKESLECEAGL